MEKKESVLIHSCESTKILVAVEQYQQDTETDQKKKYTSKTKKKPQGDGRKGKNMIKSNPKSTGWVTHNQESNNTRNSPTFVKVLTLMSRFPSLGI